MCVCVCVCVLCVSAGLLLLVVCIIVVVVVVCRLRRRKKRANCARGRASVARAVRRAPRGALDRRREGENTDRRQERVRFALRACARRTLFERERDRAFGEPNESVYDVVDMNAAGGGGGGGGGGKGIYGGMPKDVR